MPTTVTGQVARFTFLIRSLRPDREVEAELQHAVDRLRLRHAQLRRRPDLLEAPAEREVISQPDVARRHPPAVAVEPLQVVCLQVQTSADALAYAALESVGPDGEAQVQAREPVERVV